jgi:hypothetical protein
MTLFTERALLPGINDPETTETFSKMIGDFKEQVFGGGVSDSGPWGQKQQSESWHLERPPIVPPWQVSAGPGPGCFWYHSPEVA